MSTLSNSKIFLVLCLGFIFGVFLGRYLNYEIMAVLAMIFIVVASVGFQNKTILVLSLAGLTMLIGAVRFKTNYNQNDLSQFYNQTVSVIGIISDEPDVRSNKTYLTLSKLEINEKRLDSKLLVMTTSFPEYEYGQKLKFNTKITEPKEYEDFSYKNYLSRFGIDAVSYQPKIQVEQGNFGFKPKVLILRIKKKFTENLSSILPEPQNAFLGGLLLGSKRSIPEDLSEQFKRTGTSHIVAVSGYNITIIAIAIEWLLQWFGVRKRISFLISLFAIIIFVIMVGASASVVRAGIMGSLLLIALNFGRLSVAANALAFAASIMLVFNPQILVFDIGFQLSFAALIGIIYVQPLIEQYFLWMPKFLRIYFLATLSAQVFTLPILLFNFGTLSLVVLFANILVLPAIPLTMLLGFVAGILGLIWSTLATPIGWITWVLLTYIIKIIEFFGSLPFAQISWHMSIWIFISYYVIITAFLIWKTKLKTS